MTTRKSTTKTKSKLATGMLGLTAIDVLPVGGVVGKGIIEYKYRYTTGPFSLPANAGSLDWILLNNDTSKQKATVTVFKCLIGAVKTALPPGPLVVTLDPRTSTHNANKYIEGFIYEVQVDCNSQLLFPYVSVWPGNFGVAIPGTGINSGTWLRLMP